MIRNSNVERGECGTPAGYRAHQRRDEKPCLECKRAWRRYIQAYRAKKGRS